MDEGEQRARQAEIGNVFLIDRGMGFGTVYYRHFIIWDILIMNLRSINVCLTRFADVDFVTPLCSQVVYEGLVDDIFRIKCGKRWR